MVEEGGGLGFKGSGGRTHMVVSINRRPQHKPPNTMSIIPSYGDHQKDTVNLRNP